MKAPEKIWISASIANDASDPDDKFMGEIEYTRTDLIPNAAYVAGLEAAGRVFLRAYDEETDQVITAYYAMGEALSARPNTSASRCCMGLSPEDCATTPSRHCDGLVDAPDTRVVTVAQLDRWAEQYCADCVGYTHAKEEIRAIIGEVK